MVKRFVSTAALDLVRRGRTVVLASDYDAIKERADKLASAVEPLLFFSLTHPNGTDWSEDFTPSIAAELDTARDTLRAYYRKEEDG